MKAQRMLVALELLSADSSEAVDLTATFLHRPGATVHLLHVTSPRSSMAGIVPGADDADPDVVEQARALVMLEHFAGTLRVAGIDDVSIFAVPGQPADEILRHAHEHDIELIVMGTHGRTGMSRLLIGSVTASVMKRATCVVVTVHAPVATG